MFWPDDLGDTGIRPDGAQSTSRALPGSTSTSILVKWRKHYRKTRDLFRWIIKGVFWERATRGYELFSHWQRIVYAGCWFVLARSSWNCCTVKHVRKPYNSHCQDMTWELVGDPERSSRMSEFMFLFTRYQQLPLKWGLTRRSSGGKTRYTPCSLTYRISSRSVSLAPSSIMGRWEDATSKDTAHHFSGNRYVSRERCCDVETFGNCVTPVCSLLTMIHFSKSFRSGKVFILSNDRVFNLWRRNPEMYKAGSLRAHHND